MAGFNIGEAIVGTRQQGGRSRPRAPARAGIAGVGRPSIRCADAAMAPQCARARAGRANAGHTARRGSWTLPFCGSIKCRWSRRRIPDDRSVLLAHAQRPQDHDAPGRDGYALPRDSGEHRQGRAVQAGIPRHRSQQPHAGDRRSQSIRRRRADLGVRVGRNPAVSCAEERAVHPAERARQHTK